MYRQQYLICLSRVCHKSSCSKTVRAYGKKLQSTDENLINICKYFNINESKAQYLQLKYPVIKKLDSNKIKDYISTIYNLGLPRDVLIKDPSLFGFLPATLKFRYAVLQECGLNNISSQHLLLFLDLIKKDTIRALKEKGIIPAILNVEKRLASYMTQWPTSLTTHVYGDVDEFTLYSLRIKIIQRYLELILDLSPDDFSRGLHTYPTIQHRPLQAINETLNILLNQISIPKYKIKNNLYLIHADPENLKNLIYNFKSIGGINFKDIIRMHPKLAMINYATMLETRQTLEEYGINNEAQHRCFQIYTLSPATIRERLEKAKNIPEFNTYYNHPRFLKMIVYNKVALKRMRTLYSSNKKCLSLNILSGSSAHYAVYEKAPGDRLGKGGDLIFCINNCLGNAYSASGIRNVINKHPFWMNVPLIQVKYVYSLLCCNFSAQDIFENCCILLYPWNKIRDTMRLFDNVNSSGGGSESLLLEHVDLTKLSSSQKLSLVLYLLERNHYFTGNGVWSDKYKNVVELPKT